MTGFIKLTDLHRRQIRKRRPVLVGRVGGCKLVVIDRHDAAPGQPTATLFAIVEQSETAEQWQSKHDTWLPPPPSNQRPMTKADVAAWTRAVIEAAGNRSGASRESGTGTRPVPHNRRRGNADTAKERNTL